jgi:hypothetical protein
MAPRTTLYLQVLAFDNFLSSAEADEIVRASSHNFEAS